VVRAPTSGPRAASASSPLRRPPRARPPGRGSRPAARAGAFAASAPAGPHWGPRGARLLEALEALVVERATAAGYARVRTPVATSDGRLRAGALAGQARLLAGEVWGHGALPVRWLEVGPAAADPAPVTRAEAVVLCRPEGAAAELGAALALHRELLTSLGLEVLLEVAAGARPDPALEAAAAAWRGEVARTAAGDAGERLVLHAVEPAGRSWAAATLAVDPPPARGRGLRFRDADGAERTPRVVTHAAWTGGLEGVAARLLERPGGPPPWLAPEQVRVFAIGAAQAEAAASLAAALTSAGLRAADGGLAGPLAGRVRAAAADRVPYVAVVGAREAAAGRVAARRLGDAARTDLPRDAFVAQVAAAVRARAFAAPALSPDPGAGPPPGPDSTARREGRGG